MEDGPPAWFVEYEQSVAERINALTARVSEQEHELEDMKKVSERLLAELHTEQRQHEQLEARLAEANKKPRLEVQRSPPSTRRGASGAVKEVRKEVAVARGSAQERGVRPGGATQPRERVLPKAVTSVAQRTTTRNAATPKLPAIKQTGATKAATTPKKRGVLDVKQTGATKAAAEAKAPAWPEPCHQFLSAGPPSALVELLDVHLRGEIWLRVGDYNDVSIVTQLSAVCRAMYFEIHHSEGVIAKARDPVEEMVEIKRSAQEDLDMALPALEAAVEAIQTLSKAEITELATMRVPPRGVEILGEAVMFLLHAKPGTQLRVPWSEFVRELRKPMFLRTLLDLDKDRFSVKQLQMLKKKYLDTPDFDPEVLRARSMAASGLCRWVHGIGTYIEIAHRVEPKRRRLQQLMWQLEVIRPMMLRRTQRLQEHQEGKTVPDEEGETANHKEQS